MAWARRESPESSLPERLMALGWQCDRVPVGDLARPWVAVVSSRLGHHAGLHRQVGAALAQSMLECRKRGGCVLIADGSAIAPWAIRAAELFDVASVLFCCDRSAPARRVAAEPVIPVALIAGESTEGAHCELSSRDQLVIDAADRVDALFVRKRGHIERCLIRRIERRRDASTRVAVVSAKPNAAQALLAAGAVGWYLPEAGGSNPEGAGRVAPTEHVGRHTARLARPLGTDDRWIGEKDRWIGEKDRWLIHCTRGNSGAWPGQTERQHLDTILLGDASVAQRGPLQALTRIVRSGRLIASATATAKKCPVVCFSSLPLMQLLGQTCFRPHLQRWDYQPFGIAIRRAAAARYGIRPVVYGDPGDRCGLSGDDQYLFQARGATYDWTAEREWRAAGDIDLTRFAPEDVRIFVPSPQAAAVLEPLSPWQVSVVSPPERPIGEMADTPYNGDVDSL